MTSESDHTAVSVVVGAVDRGHVTVRISGEIDISNIDHVHELVDPVIEMEASQVDFDLSELSFIDSSGLALLLWIADNVPAVVVRRPSHQVQRVIEVTGLQQRLPIEL